MAFTLDTILINTQFSFTKLIDGTEIMYYFPKVMHEYFISKFKIIL